MKSVSTVYRHCLDKDHVRNCQVWVSKGWFLQSGVWFPKVNLVDDEGKRKRVRLTWSGGYKKCWAEGWGVVEVLDRVDKVRSRYVGELHRGLMHGQGSLTLYRKSTKWKKREWVANTPYASRTGRWKTWVFDHSKKDAPGKHYVMAVEYNGQWDKGFFDFSSGTVRIEYPDGTRYEGGIEGTRFGSTRLVRSGTGTMTWTDGSRYSGGWSEGQRAGAGTMNYASGEYYAGEWGGDRESGEGVLTLPSGEVFEGSFMNGSIAQGTHTHPNGEIYSGSIHNRLPSGEGALRTTDGTWYEGEFTAGRFTHGEVRWEDGNKYDGDWLDRQMHGRGAFHRPDGVIIAGGWKEGVPDGCVWVIRDEKVTHKSMWVDGQPTKTPCPTFRPRQDLDPIAVGAMGLLKGIVTGASGLVSDPGHRQVLAEIMSDFNSDGEGGRISGSFEISWSLQGIQLYNIRFWSCVEDVDITIDGRRVGFKKGCEPGLACARVDRPEHGAEVCLGFEYTCGEHQRRLSGCKEAGSLDNLMIDVQ